MHEASRILCHLVKFISLISFFDSGLVTTVLSINVVINIDKGLETCT